MVGSNKSKPINFFGKNVLNSQSASLIYLKAKHVDWPDQTLCLGRSFGVGFSLVRVGNYSELEGKTKADQVQKER